MAAKIREEHMTNLFLNNTYNWEEIIKTSLSLEIAKFKAPQLSDVTAADQIATALHEAIHLIYAVWCDIYVNFVAVSTCKNGSVFWQGSKVKGTTLAYDYDSGYSAIYSTCAAAIFELELNNKDSNFIVEAEIKIALNAARNLSWPEPNDEKTANAIVINALNTQTSNEFNAEDGQLGQIWWLIRSVAIAILVSRRKVDGEVSAKNTRKICEFVYRFCKSEKSGTGEYFPNIPFRVSMTQDIKWLRRNLQ